MVCSASFATLEVTVPPLEDAWKNWLSSNSQASAAWARNTVSTLAYWRRMPCRAKKKNCLARRRCASSMLPETSRAKITAAFIAGLERFTSCRKRRSSSMIATASSWTDLLLMDSFKVLLRSRRDRAPRLFQPSRTKSGSSMVAERRGLSSGSFSSSHSQSTISSTLSSTTKRISPSPVPPWRASAPGSRPGCSTSPGSPRPWPAPCCTLASARRSRACSMNLTGTTTVLLVGPVIRSEPARSSGSPPFTASRTLWLCRSQSRAPLEKRSYPGVSAAMRSVTVARSLLRQQRRYVVEGFTGAVRVVAVLVDEALLDHGNLLPRLVVGTRGRAHQAQHVAALLEQVLLDRVVQRRVRVERELLAALEGAHRLPDHFLAEGELAGLGDADLLFHVAQ